MNDINELLNKLDIEDIIKYYVIKLINLKGFNKNILMISNRKLNNYLDYIADTNNIILCYDIEFYNQLYNINKQYEHYHMNKLLYIENKYSIKTIRELGGLIFIKSKYNNNNINWYYIGDFIFKFNLPSDIINLQPIYTDYSDVSDETREKMNKIEEKILLYKKYDIEYYIINQDKIIENYDKIYENVKKLSEDDDFKIFNTINDIMIYLLEKNNYKDSNIEKIRSNINKLYKHLYNIRFYYYSLIFKEKPDIINLIKKINNLYINYKYIKNNLIDYNNLKIFINIFNKSKNIGKEYNDIDAIINTCYLNKIKIPSSYKYFDISFFNKISKFGCNSAKLELTYNCIINKFDKYDLYINNDISLYNIINLDKAHNPKVDALMTLVISIYIIKILLNNI